MGRWIFFFGDEGKGATTAFLADQQPTNAIIKVSGGAQTAHNVVYRGKHHEFSQFGSGFFSGVPTVASRYMMFNPFNLISEATHLHELTGVNPFELFSISEDSLLITPFHKLVNRAREKARNGAIHGSTHEGIGETRRYELRSGFIPPYVKDLKNLSLLGEKLKEYETWVMKTAPEIFPIENWPTIEAIIDNYKNFMNDIKLNIVPDAYVLEQIATGYNVFEASQGILLDEKYGFHPHTTWSTTTAETSRILSREAGVELPRIVGCTRTYATRHGAGPFPSEFPTPTSGEIRGLYPELHNNDQANAGKWRRGILDFVLLDYAVRANGGVDVLSISHLDIPTYPHKAVISHPIPPLPSHFFNKDRVKQTQLTEMMARKEFAEALVYTEIQNEDELLTAFQNRLHPTESKMILARGMDVTDRVWS